MADGTRDARGLLDSVVLVVQDTEYTVLLTNVKVL